MKLASFITTTWCIRLWQTWSTYICTCFWRRLFGISFMKLL